MSGFDIGRERYENTEQVYRCSTQLNATLALTILVKRPSKLQFFHIFNALQYETDLHSPIPTSDTPVPSNWSGNLIMINISMSSELKEIEKTRVSIIFWNSRKEDPVKPFSDRTVLTYIVEYEAPLLPTASVELVLTMYYIRTTT